jgi:choline kinase
MKAVILAAGMGRRLASMGWDQPKCLLTIGKTAGLIGETTLLGNILDSLAARGVREAVIVVGYRRELVEREASRHGISCVFVENADYATTNTIYSLYLAREHLADDFLYFNADVWFDPCVLDLLIGTSETRNVVGNSPPYEDATICRADHGGGADGVLVLDEKRCGEEEVKVVLDEGGRVLQIGKELDPADCAGEFVGIARFNRSMCSALVDSLGRYCVSRGSHGGAALGHGTPGPGRDAGGAGSGARVPGPSTRHDDCREDGVDRNLFFEAAVDDLLGEFRIVTAGLGELRAIEIDTPEDYSRAKRLSGC